MKNKINRVPKKVKDIISDDIFPNLNFTNSNLLFLSMSDSFKRDLLIHALKEKDINTYMHYSKLLIDNPRNKGGFSSEEIEKIFKTYTNDTKN
jgi:hypothetical protein